MTTENRTRTSNQTSARRGAGSTAGLVASLELVMQFGRFANRAHHRSLLTSERAGSWLRLATPVSAELVVRVVGIKESRRLNLTYRGKDYATNVLTFPMAQDPLLQADLVLCGPVIEREAQSQGKSLQAHYAHLLVHAALHAQGYDHETNERDALEMEALEILLLGALGFANPY